MKKIVWPLLLLGILVLTFQLIQSQNQSQDVYSNETAPKTEVVFQELFTSQGCSSCPRADLLLDETLKDHTKVIGLSYHVDYWNYIGWKDPFSKKEYSNYQRSYASKFNTSTIYTPQLVVNGRRHFTGSNKAKLESALKTSEVSNSIDIVNIEQSDTQVTFNVSTQNRKDLLTAVLVIEERVTSVPRGENRNKQLTNTNIVVDRTVKADTQGGYMTLEIPSFVKKDDDLKLIVFTQTDSLKVLDAIEVSLD